MAGQERFEEISQRVAQQERMIAELYGLYAGAFPQDAEMWSRLSGEEQEHADWADSVCGFCTEGKALSGWTRFPAAELDASVRQIQVAAAISGILVTKDSILSTPWYLMSLRARNTSSQRTNPVPGMPRSFSQQCI